MDLLNRDALALSGMIERREVSAAEVMQATLAQIAAWNGAVNAIVSMPDEDTLMAMAHEADATPRKGWMHGLPLAVKDLSNAKGLETSFGSPLFTGQVAAGDDLFVARMRAAGALIIGKTNVPEFGLGSHTYNPVHGPTLNPYDTGRSAGGSSGGAAVALATRMLPVADGSDMMGSLRNPAGWCNVYGFRPSWGRVPSEPLGDMFLHTMSTNGPMGRSPADIAALLQVQQGWDARQPFGLASDAMAPLEVPVQGRRIAWLADWDGAYAMEPGILELCEAALQVFRDLGVHVDLIQAPFPAEKIWEAWQTLRWFAMAGKFAPLHAQPRTKAMLKPDAVWEIESGLTLSAMQVHRASALRSEWFRAAADLFTRYDALALPTAQVWPFPVEWTSPAHIGARQMDTYHRWMEVVIPASLLGLPALAIPAGFGANGLPMGLQLIGAARNDLGVLQLGHAYHAATEWPNKMPPRQP
ncbi:amidase [Thalassobius vesicularis]|uniref:Amidase n=1 Tax=Thalassobius vesicularis TaxID=1294297 RepID=A0A4S3M9P8_9RHOB|nr:amidase [Thalassobius vesicularis]THD74798.1 amidase [Thalassobius vesicularis]